MKVAFYTLGCKVNQYDTQMMLEKFTSAGYSVVGFEDIADIYVINTCTVTQISDKKSRNMISKAKRRNTDAVIAVCGCFAQVSPDTVSAIEGVDIVIGTRNRPDILYYVNLFLKTGQKIIDVDSVSEITNEKITDFSDKTRAIIKIEDGCRNFCSYCLIPFARGKIVSKPISQIKNEVNALTVSGYREVVLTGIHLSSYGIDLEHTGLADAIEAVSQVDKIKRIRLGSLEPNVVTEDFVKRISGVFQMCPSFHLSLQSGCDSTLKAMNRKYTCEQYAAAVRLLRDYYPDCAVTTDVIVGFPGESDRDFEQSCKFIESIGFAKVHIFPYSKRPNTKAASMQDQVPGPVKHAREQVLMQIERNSRQNFMSRFINRDVRVLVERCDNGVCSGFTDNYLPVKFAGDQSYCNTFVCVAVTSADTDFLSGRLN